MKFRYPHRITPQYTSPSVWREWIEMMGVTIFVSENLKSPSVWREWIEI